MRQAGLGVIVESQFHLWVLQLLCFLRPRVLHCDRAVEDELTGGAVRVEREVAEAFELIPGFGRCTLQTRLTFTGKYFEAVGVEDGFEIAAVFFGFGFGEEAVVEPAFGVDRVRGGNPVDCAFDFAAGSRAAGFAVEVGGAAEFGDLAGSIFDDFVAFDDVGVFETDFAAGF